MEIKKSKRKGGARSGAGRPKGMPNKKTREVQQAVEESGITPLEFMLNVMRGKTPPDADAAVIVAYTAMQFEAAKAAAPYVHPKLANVEVTGKDGGPVVIMGVPGDENL